MTSISHATLMGAALPTPSWRSRGCLALRRQSLQNQQPVESFVALHCQIDPHLAQVSWGCFMRKAVSAAMLEAIATPPLLSWMSLQPLGVA